MRKVMIVLISAVVVLLVSQWILKGKVLDPLFRSYPEEYLLAVFDTTSKANNTILTYYDSDYEPVYKQQITMGSINGLAGLPVQSENKIYMAPTGFWWTNDIDSIVELDKTTGESHIYDVERKGVWNLAANEQYLFFTAADRKSAGISLIRIEKKTEKQKSLEFRRDEIDRIDRMDVYGQKLYVFACGESRSWCDIYDIDILALEERLDLTSYGKEPADTCLVGDLLYIPLCTDLNDNSIQTLLCLNISTKEIKNIDLPADSPRQIEAYQEYLLISHEGRNYDDYGSLTLYHPADEKVVNCELQSVPEQIAVRGNELYILDGAHEEMGVYSLDGEHGKVKLTKKHKLKSKDSQLRSYHMPGFFFQEAIAPNTNICAISSK